MALAALRKNSLLSLVITVFTVPNHKILRGRQ